MPQGSLTMDVMEAGYRALVWAVRRWAGLTRREVLVDDHRWVYLEGGAGEPVVLLHGFGADKDRWGLFPGAFTRDYRLLVPDLPGFGESSRLEEASYDMASQADRLHGFCRALGLHRFHLAGISMGGGIAGYYAGRHPEKVKSLLLLDPAGVRTPVPSDALRLYEDEGKNILLYRTADEFGELVPYLFHRPPPLPGPVKRFFVERLSTDLRFRQRVSADILEGGLAVLEGRLGLIRANTLVVWGRNDRVIHSSGAWRLQKGIENCRVVILDACGHMPFLEKRKETERACLDFLAL